MSTQVNIGRILPIFKGDWDDATTYQKLDIALYDGSSWVALRQNTNVTPSTNASSDWLMIASKGTWGDLSEEEKEELVEALVPYVDNISITEGINTYNDF